jgi:hypothetical protein
VVALAKRAVADAELALKVDPTAERNVLRAAVESAREVLLVESAQLLLDESLAVAASEAVESAEAAVASAAAEVTRSQAEVAAAKLALADA